MRKNIRTQEAVRREGRLCALGYTKEQFFKDLLGLYELSLSLAGMQRGN